MSNSRIAGGRSRLSLFVGSSLAAASVVGAGAIALAPTTVMAANECGDPTLVVGADTFVCAGSRAAITYPSTEGALTLTLANGTAVTSGGLIVTGSNADAVTINRSDAAAGTGDPSITNTGGAGIQATTGDAALTLTLTDGDTGDTPIAVTGTSAGLQLQSGATTATALSLTTSNGSITATAANGVGILANTTSLGAGSTLLNLGGSVTGATGIRASSAGTAVLNVTATAVSSTVLGGDIVGSNGAAIELTPSANSSVSVGAGRTVRASNANGAVIEFTNVNATRSVSVTINGGTVRSNDAAVTGYDDLAIRVAAGAGNASASVSGNGVLQGRLSFLNTGAASLTVNSLATWRTGGLTTLGASTGAGTLTVNRDALVAITAALPATIAFGGGTDTFNNAGGVIMVGQGVEGTTTLTLTGLETWNNSGQLRFGDNPDLGGDETDGVGNDRIAASGSATLFTGNTSGTGSAFRASRLLMDVDLGATQSDCLAAVTADCLDLRGGSTAGTSSIFVNVLGIGGQAERIVLVDVAGAGTSAAGHFTFDPLTPGLRNIGGAGGVLDGGLFLYGLNYDASAKQHVLSPVMIDSEGLEFGLLGRAANVAWRTTTGSWFTRQADLRSSIAEREPGTAPGAWLKIVGNFVEDTAFQRYGFGPDELDFDNSYAQDTTVLVGGVDLVKVVGSGGAFVLGLTAGQVQSDMSFHESVTDVSFEGHSGGVYASMVAGSFFVDAIVNAVKLDTDYDAATAAIANVQGEIESLGYQVEGGYRLPINEGSAFIEPLAAISYVKSDLSELTFGNVGVEYGEAVNLRGALGVRLAGDLALNAFTAQFSLTGRVWQEFEGENTATITTPFSRFDLIDDNADTLGDVGVALSLFAGRNLTANLGYGVTFTDDYQSTDASLSFRFNW